VRDLLERIHARARRSRGLGLAVVNLRLLVGFAFVPAGLKKVLGQPFTDPGNSGRFHDFLHAFHATGGFYRFVGVMQLVVAVLLVTQRGARWGAWLALPIITAIMVFCWSTGVVPTAIVATLLFSGVGGLCAWDARPGPHEVDERVWQVCGVAVLALYLAACGLTGEVYRPRGAEWHRPAYYTLVAMPFLPVIALVADRRRRRRSDGATSTLIRGKSQLPR
jgi:uncharacterized membrane protein YphA (DoxX/SURF4 family)